MDTCSGGVPGTVAHIASILASNEHRAFPVVESTTNGDVFKVSGETGGPTRPVIRRGRARGQEGHSGQAAQMVLEWAPERACLRARS